MKFDQQPDPRNPIAALPDVVRLLRALPDDSQWALKVVLQSLRDDAKRRAEKSWRTHKAPMAVYWKAVAVYANHTQRIIRPRKPAMLRPMRPMTDAEKKAAGAR